MSERLKIKNSGCDFCGHSESGMSCVGCGENRLCYDCCKLDTDTNDPICPKCKEKVNSIMKEDKII